MIGNTFLITLRDIVLFLGMETFNEYEEKDEHKFLDSGPTVLQFDTTGSVVLLNGIPAGDDYNERIGREVYVNEILVKGWASATGTQGSFNRLLLVYDMQTKGALPAVTDVLASSTSMAYLNLNNRERFVILGDDEFALGVQPAVGGGGDTSHEFCFAVADLHRVIFNNTGSNVTDINMGSIFLLSIGSNAVSCDNQVSSRIRFC